MIWPTTPTLRGKEITDYLGIVVGEVILGVNTFSLYDDIVDGRSGAYEERIKGTNRLLIR